MNSPSEIPEATHYRCPNCSIGLPFRPHRPPFDAPCTECGYPLWCSKRTVDDEVILEVVPGITPALDDVEGLVESLLGRGNVRRVFVDLADVDSLSCALVARLVVLNKKLEAAGRKLTLCGLRPIVREEFDCLGLDQAFEISS